MLQLLSLVFLPVRSESAVFLGIFLTDGPAYGSGMRTISEIAPFTFKTVLWNLMVLDDADRTYVSPAPTPDKRKYPKVFVRADRILPPGEVSEMRTYGMPRPSRETTRPETSTGAAVSKHGPAPDEQIPAGRLAARRRPDESDAVSNENCVKRVPDAADWIPTVAEAPEAYIPPPVNA